MNKCSFGFHDWTKWVNTMERWRVGYLFLADKQDITIHVATRTCELCNKEQRIETS